MAKLNGVKTVDTVNGDITKVEYNGEVYVKADASERGEAVVGDLVLITDDSWMDSTKGSFYLCVELSDINPRIIDDVGDKDSNYYNGSYELFRKASVESEPTSTKTLNTEKRHAKVGDLIKIVAKFAASGYKNGDIRKVTQVNPKRPGYHAYVLIEPDNAKVLTREYVVLEPIASNTLTHEGVEYTLVNRKAQPGDVVVFTENTSVLIDNNTPYEVEATKEGTPKVGSVIVYREKYNRTIDNVKVYEAVAKAQAFKEENTALRVGDYAKVIGGETGDETLAKGDIVEIRQSGNRYDFRCLRISDGKDELFNRGDLVKVTDEEVAQAVAEAKAKTHKASFQVGDYARVTTDNYEHKVGHIVRINRHKPSTTTFDFGVDRITNGGCGYIKAKNIEKLTAEEVEKIQAEQVEKERWTAIGRKPNEFKKGDIVINYGKIFEVKDGNERGRTGDVGVRMTNGQWRYSYNVTLITPVEQRFDLADGQSA